MSTSKSSAKVDRKRSRAALNQISFESLMGDEILPSVEPTVAVAPRRVSGLIPLTLMASISCLSANNVSAEVFQSKTVPIEKVKYDKKKKAVDPITEEIYAMFTEECVCESEFETLPGFRYNRKKHFYHKNCFSNPENPFEE